MYPSVTSSPFGSTVATKACRPDPGQGISLSFEPSLRTCTKRGQRDHLPWIQVGSRSVVTPRTPRTEMNVRALSQRQWIALRNIGFGGGLPSGELDPSYRGQSTVRNVCAVDLALTSGMRLTEWSTLLDAEIPSSDGGASLMLEACAKNARRRRVYIPCSTVKTVDLYRGTERKALVRKAQNALQRKLPTLAIATHIDPAAGKLTYRHHGIEKRAEFAMIPPDVRRVLVRVDETGSIEPLSLFVGKGGHRLRNGAGTNTSRTPTTALPRLRVQPHHASCGHTP